MRRRARQRIETGLDIRDLQARATPCNALFITRNEQVSGSSPLVGSPFSLRIPTKAESPDTSKVECFSST